MPGNRSSVSHGWEKLSLLVFGVVFLVALLALVHGARIPSRQEWYIILCILGLAAGAITALLPGTIEWRVHPGLRVTGAIAVAVMCVWFGNNYSPEKDGGSNAQTITASISFQLCTTAPDDILNTDVYVAIDNKMIAADVKHSDAPALPSNLVSNIKCRPAQRGPGGIIIDCGPVPPGAALTLFVRGIQRRGNQEKWWRTYDLRVPAMYADMQDGSKDDFTNVLSHR